MAECWEAASVVAHPCRIQPDSDGFVEEPDGDFELRLHSGRCREPPDRWRVARPSRGFSFTQNDNGCPIVLCEGWVPLSQGATSGITTYNYDAVGNLQNFVYPNGVTSAYTYDALNRLTQMGSSRSSTAISNYAYTLGAGGESRLLSRS